MARRASGLIPTERNPARGNGVREMDEAEVRRSREGEPTIDRIDIGVFETAEE